jgi:ABC-2 type transport system permease protein
MSTISIGAETPAVRVRRPTRVPGALATLARRRASLTARNPRQVAVPLITPILFVLVIAPALQDALGGLSTGIDYMSYVSVGAVGLLLPFTAIFAGLSVIVDRDSGAQRELLAAPVRRGLLVAGNLVVVVALAALQVAALVGFAALAGADFHVSVAGTAWFVAAALLFTVFMAAVAETLAGRIGKQEEYVATTPGIAVVPWFFAGALFPIGALPAALTVFAKVLPLTHVLALLRYGLVDPRGTGLHDIWGMSSTATEAWLSLAVVAVSAAGLTAIAVRTFTRSAVG